ncbi:hypothetical protein F6X53_04930, partial [Methylobacterium soli]
RGATSPDNAHPSPQPSPARERGAVAPNRTGAADFPARCNAIGRGPQCTRAGAQCARAMQKSTTCSRADFIRPFGNSASASRAMAP